MEEIGKNYLLITGGQPGYRKSTRRLGQGQNTGEGIETTLRNYALDGEEGGKRRLFSKAGERHLLTKSLRGASDLSFGVWEEEESP